MRIIILAILAVALAGCENSVQTATIRNQRELIDIYTRTVASLEETISLKEQTISTLEQISDLKDQHIESLNARIKIISERLQ